MRIIFDPATLRQSKRGAVTGSLYVDSTGIQFPSASWNDFVVVVASWWLQAVRQLQDGAQKTDLRFMDGPYYLSVAALGDGTAAVQYVENRPGTTPFAETLQIDNIASEVFGLARAVVRACKAHGIETSDLSALKQGLGN